MIGWRNPDYLSKLMLAFVKESECEVQCRHSYTIWTAWPFLDFSMNQSIWELKQRLNTGGLHLYSHHLRSRSRRIKKSKLAGAT